MSIRKQSKLPAAIDVVDRLSPETVQALAEMLPSEAEKFQRLLRSMGLGSLNSVLTLLRPEIRA